jgi:hypothetical protein
MIVPWNHIKTMPRQNLACQAIAVRFREIPRFFSTRSDEKTDDDVEKRVLLLREVKESA